MSKYLPDDSAGDVLPQSDRLQILSPEEYELLWGFPRFTPIDLERLRQQLSTEEVSRLYAAG
jgi:hypothetical protein